MRCKPGRQQYLNHIYVALSWFDPEHVDFPVARKVEVLSDEEPAPALTQVLGPTGDDGWWYVSMAGKTDLWIFMRKQNRMSSQLRNFLQRNLAK